MRIAVCDDERVYQEAIVEAIEKWRASKPDAVVVVSCYQSSEDLLEILSRGDHFDLIFLDIQIPREMSGLELAKAIRSFDGVVTLVFVTNYGEYACAGYQVNALRYLCKPVHADQVFECLDIAYRQWLYGQRKKITFNTPQGVFVLQISDILYVEAKDHCLEFHETVRKDLLKLRMSMNQLCKDLPDGLLVRCQRSFVINILYVRRILRSHVVLADETQISVSAPYRDALRAAFDQYYQGA